MLFNNFPREVGPPRKVVNNLQEWLKFVNIYNGKKKAVYTSVYGFEEANTKPNYETAIIDKIFFDFDDRTGNAWEGCNKLHQECKKEDLKHMIIMSGRGYHLYIFTEEYRNNVKPVIYNSQMYFIDKLNLNVDKQTIGNPAQLARVPNTYNLKGKRFCIPLKESDFIRGDNFCKNLAMRQNFIKNTAIIGEKLLKLKQFDFISKVDGFFIEDLNKSSSENIIIKNLPLCIEGLLKKKNLGYKQRYLIILYFKEIGYTIKEIYEILKIHLTEHKFKHCIVEEKQLQYLFERDDLVFPSCEKIKKDGFCIEGCDWVKNQKIYK